MNNYFTTVKKCTLCLNKPVLNGLSLFLIGILFLGLISCSSATEATSSIPDTTTHTISFILNGGVFSNSQTSTLKVVDGETIDQNQLGISYPPTGPNLDYLPITRKFVEWQTNGIEYDFSTPVSNDMILEAVWSNSCVKVETVHPKNRGELKAYVTNAITTDPTTNLNHIDTSAITDMVDLLEKEETFNGEISCWNVSRVTTMQSMFANAKAFNQDIGNWDVSSVNNMQQMFFNAKEFNQDISNWNVSRVTTMQSMFDGADAFNQDISNWNVSRVTDMGGMFNNAKTFNQNIGSWNVSSVINMEAMFKGASAFDQDLSEWVINQELSAEKRKDIFIGSPMAKPENADKHPKKFSTQ